MPDRDLAARRLLAVTEEELQIALYRILQEALSNIHRHSGVNAATVRVWAEGSRLCLEVIDDGRGFQPPPLSGPQATERHEHIKASTTLGSKCVPANAWMCSRTFAIGHAAR
jgi:signal transduction histidine kinase